MKKLQSALLGVSLPALLVSLAVGSLGGVGGYTFRYAEGGSYFGTEASSCANCHIMREQYDSWQHSSHHAVAKCIDCHLPHNLVGKYLVKAENGFVHSRAFTMQDFHEPIQIHQRSSRVLKRACLTCHGDMVGDVVAHGKHDSTGVVNCIHCHAGVGHGASR